MPYPNEHSCRLRSPNRYESFRRDNCAERSEGKCIDVIYGIIEGDSERQALRYGTETWSEQDARSHCDEQGGRFEPARDDEEEEAMEQNRWFSMEVKNQGTAEIWIFDEIGIFGMNADDFRDEFERIRGESEIKLYINSPGGSIFDGWAIYNMLGQVRDKLTVEVVGVAASIASVIALAGRELTMGEGSYLMIHNPWAVLAGDAATVRKRADTLDKFKRDIVNVYAKRTGMDSEEISRLMDEETWYSADEAVESGFADGVVEHDRMAARVFDLEAYGFSAVPQYLKRKSFRRQAEKIETERDAERFLRDAGFTRAKAQAIVANGFRAVLRDADGEARRDAGESDMSDACNALRRSIAALSH